MTSSDADPTSGTFSFTLATLDNASLQTRPPTATPDRPAHTSAVESSEVARGDGAVSTARALVRFLGFVTMVLLVGVGLDSVVLRPTRALTYRARVVARVAAAVLMVAGAVAVGAAHAAGVGLGESADPDVVRPFLETTAARAAVARVLLGIVLLLGLSLRNVALRRSGRLLVVVIAASVVATLALSGHAISGSHVPAAVGADLVHLLAVGVWLGGLVSLLVAGGVRDERAVRRFSTTAAWAVVAITTTGAFASWRQLGTFDRVVTTGYGSALVAKLLLVAALLALGALSRRTLRRWWQPDRLRSLVMAEVLVAALVLVAGTALVSTDPTSDADASPARHGPEASRER